MHICLHWSKPSLFSLAPPTTRQKGGAAICCDARTAVGSSACVADICCEPRTALDLQPVLLRSAVSHVQLLDLQPVLLRSAVSHVQLLDLQPVLLRSAVSHIQLLDLQPVLLRSAVSHVQLLDLQPVLLRSAVSHVQLLDLQPVLLRSAVSHVQLWIFSLWCYHHVFFLSSFARTSHLDPKRAWRTWGTFCSSHTFTILYKCRLCSLKVWRLAAWSAKSKVKPADVNKADKTSGTETLSTEYPTCQWSRPEQRSIWYDLINFLPYCKRRKTAHWRSNWSCSIWQERGGPATPAPSCQCLSCLSN